MPLSPRRISALLLAAALLGLTAAQAAGRHAPQACGQPIVVNAASSEVDYKSHTVVFDHIVISQCQITVRADHAHAMGLGFQDSRWTFDDNVQIQAPPHGSLSSNQATVEFLDNHITRATATGTPAQFTQQDTRTGKLTQGHADQIVYSVDQGTVQLSGEAWLSDGRNEFSAPLLVYNVLKDRIEASSPGPGERVHITIAPESLPARGKSVPQVKPTSPPSPRTHGRSR